MKSLTRVQASTHFENLRMSTKQTFEYIHMNFALKSGDGQVLPSVCNLSTSIALKRLSFVDRLGVRVEIWTLIDRISGRSENY